MKKNKSSSLKINKEKIVNLKITFFNFKLSKLKFKEI